ncbi:MAG TPA: septal ring lytic transglycosylase RlpA family protein [Solirubrobacteraceae bacterium]|nr:septal ring lytic transglycosylase RlpA family protein [Solirubrobacteraceae bacterium]
MSFKPANKLLPALALALMCVAIGCCAATALAGTATGGTSPGSSEPAKASKPQIATWFGPGFYGQKTACGQMMTPVVVGVASRTLPCGTLVAVNYRGHKLTVPVIDRGPYAKNGATWDLTVGAATALTITETVRIKTKVVGHAANTPDLGAPVEVQPTGEAAAAGGTAAP